MKDFQLHFKREFFVRNGLVAGMSLFLSLVPVLFMKKAGALGLVMPAMALLTLLLPLREWLIAVRRIDAEGVTRHDGKRFPWSELKELREVNFINRWGQSGGLNHLDIFFTTGRARILPMVLADGYEAILAIRQHHGRPALAASQPRPAEPAATLPQATPGKSMPCSVCGSLQDYHRAMQKGGHESQDTHLPAASGKLVTVKEVRPDHNGSSFVQQCAECDAWFLYKTTYEFLVYGSEDEQQLYRISAQQADELMRT